LALSLAQPVSQQSYADTNSTIHVPDFHVISHYLEVCTIMKKGRIKRPFYQK
jgi:uncharacterized protein YozE (UPF0346 family)